MPRSRVVILDDVGDPGAEPGTRPWAIAVAGDIRERLHNIEFTADLLEGSLAIFRKHAAWSKLTDPAGVPFATWEAFCRARPPYGLGTEPETVSLTCEERRKMNAQAQANRTTDEDLAEQEIGRGKPGPGRGNKTGDNVTRFTRGNSADFLTARIARDHPEIHDRMKAGEFKSVRQAALEAGIVKPTFTCPAEPTAAARTIIRHFDAAQRRRLIELLQQSE